MTLQSVNHYENFQFVSLQIVIVIIFVTRSEIFLVNIAKQSKLFEIISRCTNCNGDCYKKIPFFFLFKFFYTQNTFVNDLQVNISLSSYIYSLT